MVEQSKTYIETDPINSVWHSTKSQNLELQWGRKPITNLNTGLYG